MTNNSNKLFSRHRKRLCGWLGGFLVGAVFISSAVALENPSVTNKIAAPIEAINPVVEPVKKVIPPKKIKRKIAAAAVVATATAATLVDNKAAVAVVRVDDNLTPKMVDGRLLAPDIARIVARGELIVAMFGVDRPPFFSQRAGVLVGLEVDMATEIANALKVKIRFDRSAKTFDQVVDVIAHQKADLGISKLSRTFTRAQMVRFSNPYLTLNHALLLNRATFSRIVGDKSVSQVIRNFNGTIGVIEKSSFAEFATVNFPKAEIRTYSDWPEVIKALSSGEVMSAYCDEFEIQRTLKNHPAFALTLRTITLKDIEDTLSIAVAFSDSTLLAFVNQFLEQQKNKLNIKKVLTALDY